MTNKQTYSCAECGFKGYGNQAWIRMLWLWVYVWTQHQHLEPELLPEHSKILLADCRLYGWWDVSQPILS